jgi:hypothetical protein
MSNLDRYDPLIEGDLLIAWILDFVAWLDVNRNGYFMCRIMGAKT